MYRGPIRQRTELFKGESFFRRLKDQRAAQPLEARAAFDVGMEGFLIYIYTRASPNGLLSWRF